VQKKSVHQSKCITGFNQNPTNKLISWVFLFIKKPRINFRPWRSCWPKGSWENENYVVFRFLCLSFAEGYGIWEAEIGQDAEAMLIKSHGQYDADVAVETSTFNRSNHRGRQQPIPERLVTHLPEIFWGVGSCGYDVFSNKTPPIRCFSSHSMLMVACRIPQRGYNYVL